MSQSKFEPFKIYKFAFDNEGWFSSCLIPKKLDVCPCCDSQLVADAEGWYEHDNGFMMPDEVKIDCIRDSQGIRPLCSIENEYHEANRMPYVYWLPIQEKCQRWVERMLEIYYGIRPMPLKWRELNGQQNLFKKKQTIKINTINFRILF